MQQSNFIFGMLLIAFLVFITARGELATYLQLLKGEGSQAGSAGTSGNAVSAAGNTLNQIAGQLNNAFGSSNSIASLPGIQTGGTLFPSGNDTSTNAGASQAILDIFGGSE